MRIPGSLRANVMSAALLLAAAPVGAVAPLSTPSRDALQAMRELNLIVLGNLTAGHETEGKAFIAGNVTGNTSNFGIGNSSQGAAVSSRRTLTVGGNVGPTMNINQGSNGGNGPVATTPGVLIGGNYAGGDFVAGAAIDIGGNFNSGNVNLVNGQTVNVGGSISANVSGGNPSQTVNAGGSINGNANGAVFNRNLGPGWNAATTSQAVAAEASLLNTNLLALSNELRGLTLSSNPSGIVTGSVLQFNAVNGGNGYALFNIAGSALSSFTNGNNQLQNIDRIDFTQVGGPMPIIVNVSGTSINWNGNVSGSYNASLNPFIIWNFYEATTVTLNRMVHGSVLAPLADLWNITPIEGSVVARNFRQEGEVHLGTYGGNSSFLAEPIPEPASWLMMIAGFGLVGASLRRRGATAGPVRA